MPEDRVPLARPAIFGMFDGTASLLGVVLVLAWSHPPLVFGTVLAGAVSSAVSMAGGEWLSGSGGGLRAALVMGAATFGGAVLPAAPFAILPGREAAEVCAAIVALIGCAVAAMRTGRNLFIAAAETFGLLIIALAVTILASLIIPGGTL